ncbi:MAG: PAS domain-containing sensor histidine kinase [Candidatus Methylomirabilia bacterium]
MMRALTEIRNGAAVKVRGTVRATAQNRLATSAAPRTVAPLRKTPSRNGRRARLTADQPPSWVMVSAGVAHELKNLLGATELYASLIEEAVREHEDLSLLAGRLLTGIRSLSAVATNLLAFGHGREPLLRPVDLRQILEEAATFAGHAIQGTGVELETAIHTKDAPVLGEAEQLKQVFLNLLLNALQAMPKGGSLTIRSEATREHLRVIIADTGVGIPPELLPKIFDPFVTTKPKGTGLGLAIVSDILTRHRATISLASIVGQGTEACCEFPLARDPEPAGELRLVG